MKIFEIFDDELYSIKYNKENNHELHRLYYELNNFVYLDNLVERNYHKLLPKDKEEFTKDQLVDHIMFEIDGLFKYLYMFTQNPKNNFDKLFIPLYTYQRNKKEIIKTRGRLRFIRIFALRIDNNCYLVTGCAIKLTKTYQEDPDTAIELEKYNWCLTFLKENLITDHESLIYFYNNYNE